MCFDCDKQGKVIMLLVGATLGGWSGEAFQGADSELRHEDKKEPSL